MDRERTVGGLACSAVLERLSDYLDGQASAEERAAIEAHLGGCDNCARFGGTFGEAIRALCAQLREERTPGADARARLRARLPGRTSG